MLYSFEEYEVVLETVSQDFLADYVTWVASNLSVSAGSMGAEGIEIYHRLIRFGCASEDLRSTIAKIDY